MNILSQLSIADQRQIVYSSLLKYSPEVSSLRDRALDRVILGALIGSTSETPYQLTQIQANVRVGKRGPEIRDNIIQDSLVRLQAAKQVEKIEKKKRRTYYLTDLGKTAVAKTISDADSVFEPALTEILQNTVQYFTFEVGKKLTIDALLACFARYGKQLARSISGLSDYEVYVDRSAVESIVEAILAPTTLSQEAKGSFLTRLLSFFKSHTNTAQRLKFHLAQGYYFTELLGIENSHFNPLAEQNFNGAVFYLDANVILFGMLEAENRAFKEMVRLSKRLGMSLVVTTATLRELRSSALDHIGKLAQYVNTLPQELLERRGDSYTKAYVRLKRETPTLSIEQYKESFLLIDQTATNEWGIQVEELDEAVVVERDSYLQTEKAINAASSVRGFTKPPAILNHDVCHCLLVEDKRQANPKTWFLTRDSVLACAAREIAGKRIPVCFSFFGFIQSISPFVTSAEDERPLAELLTDVIASHIGVSGQVFQADELALIAEMHSDVLSTPPDQLLLALDYIKTVELNGENYDIKHVAKVSLGLRKFLSKSTDERIRAFQMETARLAAEKEKADQFRSQAEESESARRLEVAELRNTVSATRKDNLQLSSRVQSFEATTIPRKQAVIGTLGACGLFFSIAAGLRRAVILSYINGSSSEPATTLFDAGCLLVALVSSIALAPIVSRNPIYQKRLGWCAISVAVLLFCVLGNHDASKANHIIDLGIKIAAGVAAFSYISRKKRERPSPDESS